MADNIKTGSTSTKREEFYISAIYSYSDQPERLNSELKQSGYGFSEAEIENAVKMAQSLPAVAGGCCGN